MSDFSSGIYFLSYFLSKFKNLCVFLVFNTTTYMYSPLCTSRVSDLAQDCYFSTGANPCPVTWPLQGWNRRTPVKCMGP